jgi:hypothetical protein
VDKMNLVEKLALFDDHWSPRVVGELNGQHVNPVEFQGEFAWNEHEHDELFLVVKGVIPHGFPGSGSPAGGGR